MTLYADIALNFRVDSSLLEGFTDPYVMFEFNGTRQQAQVHSVSDGYTIFRFCNISPNMMDEVITATLYATGDGVLCQGETRQYSVKQYCERTLARCTDDAYAELRTLLVDLLNYGAATQLYLDPALAEDALVSSWLTAEQKAWGTASTPEVSNAACRTIQQLEQPSVTCESVGLYLEESVAIRYKLKADSTEGLSVRFEVNGRTYNVTEFAPADEEGCCCVYFHGLDASQLRETVKATVYRGTEVVSDTYCYSVECYAANKSGDTNAQLAELVKAVIRYGDAAAAYVN